MQVEVEIHPDNNGILTGDGSSSTLAAPADSGERPDGGSMYRYVRGWNFLSWLSPGRADVSRNGSGGVQKGADDEQSTLLASLSSTKTDRAHPQSAEVTGPLFDPFQSDPFGAPSQLSPMPGYVGGGTGHRDASAPTPLRGSSYNPNAKNAFISADEEAEARVDGKGDLHESRHGGAWWHARAHTQLALGACAGALVSVFVLGASLTGSGCRTRASSK